MLYLWYTIFAVIVILLSVVTVHELGHYLIARLLGVKIREFSVGVGRVKFLPKFTDSRGTVWRIGMLPLGGYVAILPDDPNAKQEKEVDDKDSTIIPKWFYDGLDKVFEFLSSSLKKIFGPIIDSKMPSINRVKGVYLNQINPIYKLLVAAAGPISNYLLSIFLLFGIYSLVGRENHLCTISEDNNGFIKDDIIVKVNRDRVINKNHLLYIAKPNSEFHIIRNGQSISIKGAIDKVEETTKLEKLDMNRALNLAVLDTIDLVKYTIVRLFSFIFDRSKKAPKLSGPVGIIKQGLEQLNKGIYYTIYWTALLSISLGVLNLLFIPPFDGGMVLLTLVDIIFGKNKYVEEVAQNLALLVVLFFLFSTAKNDFFGNKSKNLIVKEER